MGMNSGDELVVKYDGLDMAATTLGNQAKKLEEDLREIKTAIAPLLLLGDRRGAPGLRPGAGQAGQGSCGHPPRPSCRSARSSRGRAATTWVATRRPPATSPERDTLYAAPEVGTREGCPPPSRALRAQRAAPRPSRFRRARPQADSGAPHARLRQNTGSATTEPSCRRNTRLSAAAMCQSPSDSGS